MKKNISIALIIGLILNSTQSFATVSCDLTSTGLLFGLINPLSSVEINSFGTININCTGGPVSYTIQLSKGNGTISQRIMKSGTNELKYNLYTSNAHNAVLGDGTAGSLVIQGVSDADTITASYYAYGNVSNIGLASTVAGAYSDNISVMITY